MNAIEQRPRFSIAINSEKYREVISNTLRDPDRARRFTASITSAVAVNKDLQNCSCSTILAGALLGESLNLSPSPQLGQYYLVPFGSKNSTVKNAQFVLGYKGYIQLALRSGQYSDLDVMEIKDGEYLGKDPMTGKPRFSFIEDDDEREARKTVGYMAYFEYQNGFRKTLYWSKEKMMTHADKYSPAFSRQEYEELLAGKIPESEKWKYSSFWYKDFDSMAKKTMLRQLISKWGIMSIEMQTAFTADDRINTFDETGNILQEEPTEEPAAQEPAAVQEPVVEETKQVALDDL